MILIIGNCRASASLAKLAKYETAGGAPALQQSTPNTVFSEEAKTYAPN